MTRIAAIQLGLGVGVLRQMAHREPSLQQKSQAVLSRRRRLRRQDGPPTHQPMYCPPLALRLAPVIHAASSGMKKPTAYAISSGGPRRPVGIGAPVLLGTSS